MLQTFDFDEYWEFIEKYSKNKNFSIELKDLITKMLSHEPKERLTLAQVRNHPWIQQEQLKSEELKALLNESDLQILEDPETMSEEIFQEQNIYEKSTSSEKYQDEQETQNET